MHHEDCVDEGRQGVKQSYGAAAVQGSAKLLDGIEKLQVVTSLIRCISNTAVKLTPLLNA